MKVKKVVLVLCAVMAVMAGSTVPAFSRTLRVDFRAEVDPQAFANALSMTAGPTSVELGSFTATAAEKVITVRWETTSEVDNLGFNLLRATTADGPRTQLNADLIPTLVPPGSPFGAPYSYDDATVVPGVHYFYWLEQITVYGGRNLYGPVSARVEWAGRIFLPAILADR